MACQSVNRGNALTCSEQHSTKCHLCPLKFQETYQKSFWPPLFRWHGPSEHIGLTYLGYFKKSAQQNSITNVKLEAETLSPLFHKQDVIVDYACWNFNAHTASRVLASTHIRSLYQQLQIPKGKKITAIDTDLFSLHLVFSAKVMQRRNTRSVYQTVATSHLKIKKLDRSGIFVFEIINWCVKGRKVIC